MVPYLLVVKNQTSASLLFKLNKTKRNKTKQKQKTNTKKMLKLKTKLLCLDFFHRLDKCWYPIGKYSMCRYHMDIQYHCIFRYMFTMCPDYMWTFRTFIIGEMLPQYGQEWMSKSSYPIDKCSMRWDHMVIQYHCICGYIFTMSSDYMWTLRTYILGEMLPQFGQEKSLTIQGKCSMC